MAFSLKMAGGVRRDCGRRSEGRRDPANRASLAAQAERSIGRSTPAGCGGRAIVQQPRLFLFDEPLSNLDASLRVQMRIELSRLHQRTQDPMIYVTHDRVEAMTLGQRIVVFNGGHIEQIGKPLELYEKPANLFVAGFLGSPKMNFIKVKTIDQTRNLRELLRHFKCPTVLGSMSQHEFGTGVGGGAHYTLALSRRAYPDYRTGAYRCNCRAVPVY